MPDALPPPLYDGWPHANGAAPYNKLAMDITLTELEQAINYWRTRRPSSGEERALSPEVDLLATSYAMMIFHHATSTSGEALGPAALQLIDTWRKHGSA